MHVLWSLTLMYSTALEIDQYRSSEMRQMLRMDAVQRSTSTAECICFRVVNVTAMRNLPLKLGSPQL